MSTRLRSQSVLVWRASMFEAPPTKASEMPLESLRSPCTLIAHCLRTRTCLSSWRRGTACTKPASSTHPRTTLDRPCGQQCDRQPWLPLSGCCPDIQRITGYASGTGDEQHATGCCIHDQSHSFGAGRNRALLAWRVAHTCLVDQPRPRSQDMNKGISDALALLNLAL